MKIYNPNLPQSLIDELNRLNATYFQFDEPIPFKDGLTLYPINVRYHDEFLAASECLTLNKDDVEGNEDKTNLEYLLLKMSGKAEQQDEDGPPKGALEKAAEEKKAKEEQARISQYFIRICELVFHVKYGIRCAKCGKVYDYQEFLIKALDKEHPFHCECYKGEEGEEEDFDINIKYRMNPETKKYEILINGITITSEDFDRLRQIVMYQNLPDFKDDTWVDPDMRADQAEKQRLLAKKNNAGTATLERKIVCVSAKSCYKIEDIYKLTMRKFLILLSAIDDAMNYECTRIGLMTGMVSMKEPVEHWIYKKESDDLYGGEAVSLDDIQENISSA